MNSPIFFKIKVQNNTKVLVLEEYFITTQIVFKSTWNICRMITLSKHDIILFGKICSMQKNVYSKNQLN